MVLIRYNPIMDARLLREYRQRWKSVREVELEEQRRTSISMRWQQLNALYAMAGSLLLACTENEKEPQTIRARWVKLKRQM